MGAIYLDKVSKIEQKKLPEKFEDRKYYIVKLFKGETSKIVLISTNSIYLVDHEIQPYAPCDKYFFFNNSKEVDFQKVLNETFEN